MEKIDGDAFRKRFERHLSWVLSAGKGGERGDFSGLDLDGANLHGYTLHRARFAGASLRRAELRRAELRDADLAGADLGGAFLHDAVLAGASLRAARLAGAELVRADFSGADLSDADFAGADLLAAVLDGANLDGAELTSVLSLKPAQLAKARLTSRTRLPDGVDGPDTLKGYAWSGDVDREAAHPLDRAFQPVPALDLAGSPGRAGEDQISRLEPAQRGQPGDDLGDRPDQIR